MFNLSFSNFDLYIYLLLLNSTAEKVDSSSLYTWGHLPFLHTSPSSSSALSPYCSPPAAVSLPAVNALPGNTTKPSNQSRAINSFINSFKLHICIKYHKRSGNSHFFSSSSSSSSKLTTSLGFRVSGLKFPPDITILWIWSADPTAESDYWDSE